MCLLSSIKCSIPGSKNAEEAWYHISLKWYFWNMKNGVHRISLENLEDVVLTVFIKNKSFQLGTTKTLANTKV